MRTFSYFSKNDIPSLYSCSVCGAKNVKLWRNIVALATDVELYCVDCAMKKDGVSVNVEDDGKYFDGYDYSDQFNHSLPAVPTEDGLTYWQYTAVPYEGCVWWRDLPLRATE